MLGDVQTNTVSPVFVGRAGELAALTDALARAAAGEPQALLVGGEAGVGKTRLAIGVAHAVSCRVVYVPLADLSGPSLVPLAIGQQLGLRDLGSRPVEILARLLGSEPVLLVLDNMEHLLSAAPLASELLASCPQMTILVTSRTRSLPIR